MSFHMSYLWFPLPLLHHDEANKKKTNKQKEKSPKEKQRHIHCLTQGFPQTYYNGNQMI